MPPAKQSKKDSSAQSCATVLERTLPLRSKASSIAAGASGATACGEAADGGVAATGTAAAVGDEDSTADPALPFGGRAVPGNAPVCTVGLGLRQEIARAVTAAPAAAPVNDAIIEGLSGGISLVRRIKRRILQITDALRRIRCSHFIPVLFIPVPGY
eukprot:SAG11_NODE_3683_length_2285_cov_4.703111_2_plen_157_part_00